MCRGLNILPKGAGEEVGNATGKNLTGIFDKPGIGLETY